MTRFSFKTLYLKNPQNFIEDSFFWKNSFVVVFWFVVLNLFNHKYQVFCLLLQKSNKNYLDSALLSKYSGEGLVRVLSNYKYAVSFTAVFKGLSKVITRLRLLRLAIGYEIPRQFF